MKTKLFFMLLDKIAYHITFQWEVCMYYGHNDSLYSNIVKHYK